MWWYGLSGVGGARIDGAYVASQAAAEAGAAAQRARSEVEYVAKDVDRLFMVTQALWQILKDEHGYDDATLQRKVMAIDHARHAAEAGGETAPKPCAGCGRPVSQRHPRCIYCGAQMSPDVFAH